MDDKQSLKTAWSGHVNHLSRTAILAWNMLSW